MQALLVMWLALGAVSAVIMHAGLRARFERMTPRLWYHVVVSVPLWPIALLSGAFVVTGHPNASRILERFTIGWGDTIFDGWDLWRLRRRGGDGGSLAYLRRDLSGTDLHGNPVHLDHCDDVVMAPEVFVQLGGALPKDRPDGDALIRVRKGVAQWEM